MTGSAGTTGGKGTVTVRATSAGFNQPGGKRDGDGTTGSMFFSKSKKTLTFG